MLRCLLLASAALSLAAPASAATQAIIVGNLIPDAATGPTGPAFATVFDGGSASSTYPLGPAFDCGTSV